MDILFKYFPALTSLQKEQFAQLKSIYTDWNSKINVISRKDLDSFYLHHVLHSLAIAQFVNFIPGTRIIDVGTGGGFPGIPLSIFFPETQFTLLDSIAKKIKVVQAVSDALELKNTSAVQSRSEDFKGRYDFIVSRAVTNLPDFVRQTRHLITSKSSNAIANGILYLKGGDISEETAPFKKKVFIASISDWFDEPFFETKKLVHLTL
ncbi:16S rRNA (guanine(527)-N(7))-methyltransferase RsmG [Marinilabilia salmonicolor]|uniref:16S rRNA (guanine(527)-N(7))-methyltransferase RsmG n=1 Tax=Marinilabilia salmonicolor TaxID=989 RepID=UPI00029A3BBE|nr:16S rRNA (guanine(527)-N(7))-methyltransferase RsmG [Marinilabilia salmonicolor]